MLGLRQAPAADDEVLRLLAERNGGAKLGRRLLGVGEDALRRMLGLRRIPASRGGLLEALWRFRRVAAFGFLGAAVCFHIFS